MLQHHIGARVANTFSTPRPLDTTVPDYHPPPAESFAHPSDESITTRAVSALSDTWSQPTKLKDHEESTSHHKSKPAGAVAPTGSKVSGSSSEGVTSLSVLPQHELTTISASASLYIKHAVEEHFADPIATLTRNARNQVSNLTAWSYEMLVVLSRVTLDFLTQEAHMAQSEISRELSRIRAAAEAVLIRPSEIADHVSSAMSHSAKHVRQAARLSARQAHDAASFSLQQANSAMVYSSRKAREAYAYLHLVTNHGNRRAARGARRVVREVTQTQSSIRKAACKSAQKAKSQFGDSLAAGVRLASNVGRKAVSGASKGAQNIKHRSQSSKQRCGKGCGSKKSAKSKCGRRGHSPRANLWKRNRR